ncbi:MAG: hypothetical protein QM783_19895 [Phycisphaerales bacterium]
MAAAPNKLNGSLKKRPGRKRRAAGWALLAFALAICVAWGVSRWWDVKYHFVAGGKNCDLFFTRGFVGFWRSPSTWETAPPGWSMARLEPASANFDWWFKWSNSGDASQANASLGIVYVSVMNSSAAQSHMGVWVLFWPIVLMLVGGGAMALWSGRRARRRAMTGCCRACGYSLAGLGEGAACPECGKGASESRAGGAR